MRFWLVSWRTATTEQRRDVTLTKREAETVAESLRTTRWVDPASVAVSALYVDTGKVGGRKAAAWWGLRQGLGWVEADRLRLMATQWEVRQDVRSTGASSSGTPPSQLPGPAVGATLVEKR